MTDAQTADFSISDHALLRWLERVHGIDVEFFREQLRSEVRHALAEFGNVSMSDEGVFSFVMNGGCLVTILEPGWRVRRRGWLGGVVIPRVPA